MATILHIIPTYKPAYVYGGPVFSTSLICENLAREGHEVLMLTTRANGKTDLDVPANELQIVDGVPTIYFHRWTKDHSHFSPRLLWYVFKNCKKYDAVHIHSWWNLPVMFSVLICWLRGVRPVLSPRGMLSDFTFSENHSSAKAIFHKTAGLFLLKKTRLHLTSVSEQKECAHIGTESFVLPNYIELSPIIDFDKKGGREPVLRLLFLSRVHPKKNLEALLEALTKINFDFSLKIAGPGENDYIAGLKRLARKLGLESRIEWLGVLAGEEKFSAYAAADLFVLPSHNENFANVVIESLSAGTPVLVSEEVGLSEYVREKGLGWVCGKEAENIAAALDKIFQQKTKLRDMARQAVQTIQTDFSPKKLTEKYIARYLSREAAPQSVVDNIPPVNSDLF
ncbi:MAG TPA: glycosyltransferase [Bacteroidetes bacterium]|nr:glycosyltransferase [Bacteroidota bacterium]